MLTLPVDVGARPNPASRRALHAQNESFRIDFEAFLETYATNALTFLEYGVGATTYSMSQFIRNELKKNTAFFLSVDDDPGVLDFACTLLERRAFEYFILKDLRCNTQSLQHAVLNGAKFPGIFKEPFDFVCIDCARFPICIAAAANLLAPRGKAVLHSWTEIETLPSLHLFKKIETVGRFIVLSEPKKRAHPHARRETRLRRAIVVPLQGSAANLEWRITRSWLHSYAERVGAALREIRVPADIASPFVKFYAARHAGSYDQFLFVDADVIIRSHAPDLFQLVPLSHLGVMPEGRIYSRQDWLDENTVFFGAIQDHRPYFNSGVMVLSRDTLKLLFQPCRDMLAFPRYEQNFLNWRAAQVRVPLFELPLELNYIAGPGFLPDWRRSFLYHFAGPQTPAFTHDRLWSMQPGYAGARAWHRTYPSPTNYRYFEMRIVDQQLRGRALCGINCDEMIYAGESGIAVLNDGVAHAFIRQGRGVATCGRLTNLSPGRYLIRIVTSAKALKAGAREILVEILIVGSRMSITPASRLRFNRAGTATCPEIAIDRLSQVVEIRFHRNPDKHTFILGIELQRAM